MSLYEGGNAGAVIAVHAGERTSHEPKQEVVVMPNMMDGGMMWGMGIGWLITLVVAALVITALVKYVFFR
jgi:hypothetical protein